MSGACAFAGPRTRQALGGVVAVKNMSFDLRAGEIVGLIGPNGSGKSTVMSLIMGIARRQCRHDQASTASTSPDGRRIASRARASASSSSTRARCSGRPCWKTSSSRCCPDSLLRLATEASVTERARAIAERVGLGGVLHRHPVDAALRRPAPHGIGQSGSARSQGGADRRAVRRADAAEITIFSDLIRTFRDEGRAVLLVDHSVKSVAALADRVIAMYLGERIAEGSADEVMQNETVRRVYIGGKIEAVERRGPPHAAAATLLEIEAVEVFYGKANALDRVDVTCAPGRIRLHRRP